MFPEAKPRGTLRVSGKQNSLFPLGPVIKCLMIRATTLERTLQNNAVGMISKTCK